MKSRRNKNNSKRRLPKQNTKKHSGGGPKKGKTPTKPKGPPIDDVIEEMKNIFPYIEVDVTVDNKDTERVITKLIDSVGKDETKLKTINYLLDNEKIKNYLNNNNMQNEIKSLETEKANLESKIQIANISNTNSVKKETNSASKMASAASIAAASIAAREEREKAIKEKNKKKEAEEKQRTESIQKSKSIIEEAEKKTKESAAKEANERIAAAAKAQKERKDAWATKVNTKSAITSIISNKPKSADKVVNQDLTNYAAAAAANPNLEKKAEPSIPTTNVDEKFLPPTPPTPKKGKVIPTTNVDEKFLPPVPPTSKKGEIIPTTNVDEKFLPPVPPTSKKGEIIPTTNVDEKFLPPAHPTSKKGEIIPTTNVDEKFLPPAPQNSPENEQMPTVSDSIRAAWIETEIFTENQLLILQHHMSNLNNDFRNDIQNNIPAYSNQLDDIPKSLESSVITDFNDENINALKDDLKTVLKTNKKTKDLILYYNIIYRILYVLSVLFRNMYYNQNLDFRLCLKGGIAAQLLISNISREINIPMPVYQTDDIDLIVLPQDGAEYDKAKLKQHALNISELIEFCLGNTSRIKVLKPDDGSARNEYIVKHSFVKENNSFTALMDIDFKELPNAIKPFYENYALHHYGNNAFQYVITQNIDAFIKEKLFYKAYYEYLYEKLDCKNTLDYRLINECNSYKQGFEKFKKSSSAILNLYSKPSILTNNKNFNSEISQNKLEVLDYYSKVYKEYQNHVTNAVSLRKVYGVQKYIVNPNFFNYNLPQIYHNFNISFL